MSTVGDLINQGRSENSYNNSGIEKEITWISFFNDALNDLVDDLNIQETVAIEFTPDEREYDLPGDYHAIVRVYDDTNYRISKRPYYNMPGGYMTFNRGNRYVIDFYDFNSPKTFTVLYERYPTALGSSQDAVPEVPRVGERALIYYALEKALRNNNQVGMAQEMKQNYERERLKIRNAVARG